ncbi:PA2169 family four-helix-bundle protein [Pedobacter polaris]|uniref:PA2169 family four-helix-bundle protein n=1 Tax=Pedobacter polaris TaxID=2571273 RepID=A0A4U1CSG0_9SPHI|nr:PA2169 family four-helix-bundle protein [Pedobacter polaris]TKC09965.1 PA2169 family four-helix-bundle protein [Pedobacter polaris]
MENNQDIIADLKSLISIVNDGKEGYQSAADVIENPTLKGVFLKNATQRFVYEQELKAHILKHGGVSDNEEGGILGFLHRTWIGIKEALSSKEETSVLSAIETGEQAALDKYDQCIKDYENHADHLELLIRQRAGILDALKEVEVLHQELSN